MLAAISIFGCESFVLIEGGCKYPIWCYFVAEAFDRFHRKYSDIPKNDIVLIYDNAKMHTLGFGGWFSRKLPGIKLTISPYTPEVKHQN